MNWRYGHWVWMLIIIPVAVTIFLAWSQQKIDRILNAWGLRAVTPDLLNQDRARVKLKQRLWISALVLIIIAALGPQWGVRKENVTRTGLDLVIALDVSASMGAEDLQPSRLAKAISEIHRLLSILQGDRVGLVTFEGSATAICPLTLDYGAIDLFLGALGNYHEARAGTNIQSAYETAKTLFDFKAAQDKLLLILTDGENHEGSLDALRADAQANGIIVVPVAVGTTSGQPVPEISSDGVRQGYKKDKQGNVVISHIDVDRLREIATIGPYWLDSNDKTLVSLPEDLKQYKRGKLADSKISIHEDRYAIFLSFGIVLLLLSYLVKERKD